MASPFRPLARAAVLSLLGMDTKSVWGGGTGGFLDFMGINRGSSGGPDQIEDNRSDYTRAAVSESYVYKCLTIRGNGIAQAPLRVWKLDADGRRGDSTTHEALDLLKFTNPKLGQVRGIQNLMRYTLGSLDLHGRCAWQLATAVGGGRPLEIYWLDPTSYEPVRDSENYFGGLKLRNGGSLPPERVVYLTTPNLADPLAGVSKIKVLRDAINLRRSSVWSNLAFFLNSMRPDWILSGNFLNTEDNIKRIRNELRKTLSGDHNKSPLVLGEEAKATMLSLSPKDAEWINQQRFSGAEIGAVFAVSDIYLNNFTNATYENINTAKQMLWHDGLMPDGDVMAEALTRDFLWRFWPDTMGKMELGFDYAEVDGLAEDVNQLVERTMKIWAETRQIITEGALTPNQSRPIFKGLADQLGLESVGFDGDVPGGDVTLDLYTKIPRDQNSVQAVIDIMAARGENPELVEDVPGAPNAGKNAQAAARRRASSIPPVVPTAGQDPQQPTEDNPPSPKGLEATEVAEIVRLTVEQLGGARQTSKAHPRDIRAQRLATPIADLTRGLKRYFQDLQREALKTLRGPKARTIDELKALPSPDQPLYNHDAANARLTDLIKSGVTSAAEAAWTTAKEDHGLDVVWHEDHPFVAEHLGMRTAMIKGINLTTQKALAAALKTSVEKGESINQAADRVSEVFRDAIDNRSEVIARSEIIPAYNMASLRAYREAGLEKAEMYDGDGDEECADMDGQILSLDEAEAAVADEHVNGTRGCAPYFGKAAVQRAVDRKAWDFDSVGTLTA